MQKPRESGASLSSGCELVRPPACCYEPEEAQAGGQESNGARLWHRSDINGSRPAVGRQCATRVDNAEQTSCRLVVLSGKRADPTRSVSVGNAASDASSITGKARNRHRY